MNKILELIKALPTKPDGLGGDTINRADLIRAIEELPKLEVQEVLALFKSSSTDIYPYISEDDPAYVCVDAWFDFVKFTEALNELG
jgi:hypothetical protein